MQAHKQRGRGGRKGRAGEERSGGEKEGRREGRAWEEKEEAEEGGREGSGQKHTVRVRYIRNVLLHSDLFPPKPYQQTTPCRM